MSFSVAGMANTAWDSDVTDWVSKVVWCDKHNSLYTFSKLISFFRGRGSACVNFGRVSQKGMYLTGVSHKSVPGVRHQKASYKTVPAVSLKRISKERLTKVCHHDGGWSSMCSQLVFHSGWWGLSGVKIAGRPKARATQIEEFNALEPSHASSFQSTTR